MNRSVLNLALLGVVTGLGIAIWLSQETKKKGPPLTSLDPESISKIELAHPGKPVIKLHRREDQWFLSAPVAAAADKFEVNGILALADLELQKTFDSPVDPKELGLVPPAYTVTLDQTLVRIGGKEPIQHRRYVAVDERLGLVADPPSAALDEDYSDLISRRIVPEGAELVSLRLPDFSLSRDPEGQWSSMEQADATPDQLQKLVDAWNDARAMWNAAEPDAGSEGDPVTLEFEDGSQIQLRVHQREPQLVLAREDLKVHYTLSKALVTELLSLPEAPISESEDAVESAQGA